MKETFLFIFLYILQYIHVQSHESQLAIAPFQPDFSFKSLQKYLEFPGRLGKMKTSSECMLTEGSLSCYKHHYQKQSSTQPQQYIVA